MFDELDSIHNNNPIGYWDLIKSMRDGNFDREVADDTFSISSKLLSKNVESKQNSEHRQFSEDNLGPFRLS